MTKDEILKVISTCGAATETVEIDYPATKEHSAGWREVEPYSIRTNCGKAGEKLDYGSDYFDNEHFFCARNCEDLNGIRYFKIGKIDGARATGNYFRPEWDVEF